MVVDRLIYPFICDFLPFCIFWPNSLTNKQYVAVCGFQLLRHLCISRSISEICRLMVEVLMPEWIKVTTDPEEKSQVKQNFYEKHGFRRVLWCIDGSHIAIVPLLVTDGDENHLFVDNTGPTSREFNFVPKWSQQFAKSSGETVRFHLPVFLGPFYFQ